MSEQMEDRIESRGAKRKERIDKIKAQEQLATREVMATVQGRLFVSRILKGTGFLSISFTGSSETFFREGRRSVGLQLYNELMDLCPDLYWQMVKEQLPTTEVSNG